MRRSGRYPRLACAAAIPSARRPPDLGRMVDVENPEATAWGEALTLRVLIWIVPALSSTAMTYNWSKGMSFLAGKRIEDRNTRLGVGQSREFERVEVAKISLRLEIKLANR